MIQERLQEIIRQAQAALAELDTPQEQIHKVFTADQLRVALQTGGMIEVASGLYGGNFVISKPTILMAEEVTFKPEDRYKETLTILSSDTRVIGPDIFNGAIDRECVLVGSHAETDYTKQPHRVSFANVGIHAGPDGGRRGLSLHGSDITVEDSDVTGFYYTGSDAQGIYICNGAGPYLIDNCYVEGSGENLMVGGDKINIGRNPADITIRNSMFHKPDLWRTYKHSVKNILELKAGERVVIENNTFDGWWMDAQSVAPIVFTPRNQYGDNLFVKVDDVTFRNNTLVNCNANYAINILGRDNINVSQPMTKLIIEGNNFFDAPAGLLIANADQLDLIVHRNSFLGIKYHFLSFEKPTIPHIKFTENVARTGLYAIRHPEARVGIESLKAGAATYEFFGNVIEQPTGYNLLFPPDNRTIANGKLDALLSAEGKMVDGSAGY